MVRKDIEDKIEKLRKEGATIYSFSRLEVFNECAAAYDMTYNKKLAKSDNVYSVLGGAIHESLEKIYNGEDIDILKNFEEDYGKTIGVYDFPNNARENYLKCMKHYCENFKKDDLNSLQEYPFIVEINGRYITGIIDRITKDPNSNENTLRIIDYKTSTLYKSSDLVKKGRQLVLYAYAIEQMTGQKVTSICWDMLKYVHVQYNKKTRKRRKLFLRNEFIYFWKEEILEELTSQGMDFMDALEIYMSALQSNQMPKELSDVFTVSEGYVEYEYNEETKEELLSYLTDVINKIESENKWEYKKITANNNFNCLYLCNNRENCKALQMYFDSQTEDVEKEEIEEIKNNSYDFSELFGGE